MKSLDVLTVGSGSTLVFCISGMFAGSWMWESFLDAIDAKSYKFFLMKDAICEIANNVEEVAKKIEDNLTSNNLSKVIIVGNSLGGVISLQVSQARPDLISKTIISGTPHGVINLGVGMPRRNNREWVNTLANKILYKKNRIDEATDQLLPIFSKREPFLNMLGLSRTLSGESVTKYLDNVLNPIHAIWGEKDEITPVSYWEEMQNLYSNLSLTKIEDSGHSPMYEDPGKFAETFTRLTLESREKLDEHQYLKVRTSVGSGV